MQPVNGRYKANCDTPPCYRNHLGMFDTPEEAAQLYLQHQQNSHGHPASPPCLEKNGKQGRLIPFNALHEQQQQQQQQ